ncbi:hypothetical protein B0J11DRAFT_617352 [Dendryphion nanum]|uniref:Uncharacterized protein n=1 Tax=Dendryphion nanum TaxID=256645 RepID=A0A9P9DGM8_9PLEO|nr:hypothetical protein B0J11DRAFT_617352 [Dendryphion nanum]
MAELIDEGQSPPALLRRLPAELRNCIYEYALTEPEGVLYHKESGVAKLVFINTPENIEPVEVNQLKYANSQLYRETKGLTLHYNEIVFVESGMEMQKNEFRDFLSTLSNTQKSNLHSIRFSRTPEAPSAAESSMPLSYGWHLEIHDVIKLCQQNPTTNIKLHKYGFSTTSSTFPTNLLYYETLFRGGDNITASLPGWEGWPIRYLVQSDAPKKRHFYNLDKIDKLWIYPCEEPFNETEFRLRVEKWVRMGILTIRFFTLSEVQDAWVARTKELRAHGIKSIGAL